MGSTMSFSLADEFKFVQKNHRHTHVAPVENTTGPANWPSPQKPLHLIGNVHGRADLLRSLLTERCKKTGDKTAGKSCLVFTGNYIGYGAGSADVLEWIRAADKEFPDDVFCLRGVQEQRFLSFLNNPLTYGQPWLASGGRQVLESFGLEWPRGLLTADGLLTLRNSLINNIPQSTISWLQNLPRFWQGGNVLITPSDADSLGRDSIKTDTAHTQNSTPSTISGSGKGLWHIRGVPALGPHHMKRGCILIDTGSLHLGTLAINTIQSGADVSTLIATENSINTTVIPETCRNSLPAHRNL